MLAAMLPHNHTLVRLNVVSADCILDVVDALSSHADSF